MVVGATRVVTGYPERGTREEGEKAVPGKMRLTPPPKSPALTTPPSLATHTFKPSPAPCLTYPLNGKVIAMLVSIAPDAVTLPSTRDTGMGGVPARPVGAAEEAKAKEPTVAS